MLYTQFLHRLAGESLNVEPVYHAVRFGECRTYNPAHGIGQVKGDFRNSTTESLVNTVQNSYYILGFCSRHNGDQGALPSLGIAVGDKCVQIAVGKRGLVNGQQGTDIPGEQQPLLRMFQLVPLTKTAQYLLVLPLKGMSVYMIVFLKRTAGHWGCLHTSLLKKLRIPWSNVCPWLQCQDLWV